LIFTLPWKTLAWLGGVDVVEETWPNVDDVRTWFEPSEPRPKFGWLSALNASRRKSRARLSRIGNIREIWESSWKYGGVLKAFLLIFP
jgi:hypothetical protein